MDTLLIVGYHFCGFQIQMSNELKMFYRKYADFGKTTESNIHENEKFSSINENCYLRKNIKPQYTKKTIPSYFLEYSGVISPV